MNKIFCAYDQGITYVVRALNRTILEIRKQLLLPRMSKRELIVLYKRLGMMLQSDMTITSVLQLMIEETNKRGVQMMLQSVVSDVSAGSNLSVALGKFSSVVGQYSLHIIALGEASGTLAINLEYLADELTKRYELRKQIIGSLLYPAIVFTATVCIAVFLLVAIFPKILPIFLSLKSELPFSTRMLIWLSTGLSAYGLWLAGMGIIIMSIFSAMQKIFVIRKYTHQFILRLPLFGRLCQSYNVATISRTLGLLLISNVRINDALDIVARSTNNLVYQAALMTSAARVAMGKNLATSFSENKKLWPVQVIHMIRAGESTGNLAVTCRYLSDMYEADIRESTKTMTVLLEPLLMLFMGLCVGFIAISIITPIYGITAQLHQ